MWWFLVRGALAASWYADVDGDGYGDPAAVLEADEAPAGYVADDSDCNDADADVSPSELDGCDGVDNDCSGSADDAGDCPCEVEYFGTHTYLFCTTEQTWQAADDLCQTVGYHLAGVNSADENAWVDATADAYSTDKWWFGFNDIASEGAFEWVDGSAVSYTNWQSGEPNDSGGDEDCGQFNRFTDLTWNDEPCTFELYSICEFASPINWYADADGDGFGDPTASFYSSDQPVGYVEDASDCDDRDAAAYPGGEEVCDGVDQDCDGAADDGLPTTRYYPDADGDGFGNGALGIDACEALPAHVIDGTDCDDADAGDFPGAAETVGNEDDEDCDGGEECYADADVDGYGGAGSGRTVLSPDVDCGARGESTTEDDCDDADPLVNPGAADVECDGVDNDCDGVIDGGRTPERWYPDADGDGHGDPDGELLTCEPPAGHVTAGTDCDDADPAVYVGAPEVTADGVDQDCDDGDDCWRDGDADGYGAPSAWPSVDLDCADGGESYNRLDCDDESALVNPGMPEIEGNFRDDDCDGRSDEAEVDDTDGDGLDDVEEGAYGTDPLDPDTDRDGLLDGDEVWTHETNPLEPDTDNGGVPDGEEVDRGSDPLDPADDRDEPDTDPGEDTDTGGGPDTDERDTDERDTDDGDGDTDTDGDTDGSGRPRDTDDGGGRAFGGGGCRCDGAGGSASGWGAIVALAIGLGRRRRGPSAAG